MPCINQIMLKFFLAVFLIWTESLGLFIFITAKTSVAFLTQGKYYLLEIRVLNTLFYLNPLAFYASDHLYFI